MIKRRELERGNGVEERRREGADQSLGEGIEVDSRRCEADDRGEERIYLVPRDSLDPNLTLVLCVLGLRKEIFSVCVLF